MTAAPAPNDKALKAFLAAKREIDGMRAHPKTLSDDHFDTSPTRSIGAMLAR